MKTEYSSNLLSASSLLICCAGRKFTSQKIKLISSVTISFLILITSLNATEAFAQSGRNFKTVNKNIITKSELRKTTVTNGEVEQEWVAIYSGVGGLRSDEAVDLAVDSSGNVYVTGISQGLGYDFDCATIKYNTHGEVLWISRYDGGYDDYVYKLALDNSGNVYITGSSYSSGTGEDYLTIKYNSEGDEQWIRKYNGPGNSFDKANDLSVDNEGNVYVTGESFGLGTYSDFATIKYNPSGVEQWVKRYNGPDNSYDEALALTIDNTGNIYVTGKSIGLFPNYNYATVKYNTDGVEKWVSRYIGFGNSSDIAYDVAVDNAGSVIVTGESPDSNSITPDYLTVKYDSSGMQQWTVRYNGPGDDIDFAKTITVDDNGNIIITGVSRGDEGRWDWCTIKYDSSGIERWVSRFNGGFVYDLALDKSGNVYVTGVSWDSTTTGAYTTIKYDTYGVQQWFIRYNGPGDFDEAKAMALDETGNVYVTGITYVPGGIPTFDYTTIKYKQTIVPVELTNFTAALDNDHIILNWQTASETNNLGFEIQRFQNSKIESSKDWKTIGFVSGFGTTTETESYTFEDYDVSNGVYYYRLKQIDFDGSFEYSYTVEVSFGILKEFSLDQNFPNPFNSTTTINYSIADPSSVVLKLYNTLGEEVAVLVNEEKDTGKYSLKFNAKELPSGIYLYKLNASGNSGEYNFVKKFILLR
ncbi:MAG: SBBP repeat-containing protein [Ignavibacteriaceae bacterium]|nr:SBBP repeat-containing protein [Ignavibacteriaceae bacterium]